MAQRITEFMQNEQGALTTILRHVTKLRHLNQQVAQHLRPMLAPHCRIASLQEGRLCIAVDNAAFATQLRYDIPSLLEQFRIDENLPDIKRIDFYIDAAWQMNEYN